MRSLRLLLWPSALVLRPLRAALLDLVSRWFGAGAARRRKAQRLATTMLHEFGRLGFTRKIRSKKKTVRQRVKFEYPLLMTHDELWCPINLSKLPTGVRTDDLRDPTVLQSMEDRLNAAVRIDYLATGKLCFVVRLAGSAFPPVVSINQFQIDPEAPALAIPLGLDREGQHKIADLTELKHLLVAGATGGGKTTFLHALINTLISRNSAEDLELWLIDLKGSEFPRYKALMGTKSRPGIVRHIATDVESAIEVLNLAYREIQRRNALFEQHGAADLRDLRSLTGQQLRRIVLVFDEIAILTLDKSKIGKQSAGQWGTFLMTKIAALGRSAGVSIVVATQFVNKEVLSGTIRANFENRVSFSCADWRQSQLIVESSEADGLPVGRAIVRQEGRTMEVQTCLITPKQARLEVARIAEYGPDGGLGEADELGRFVRDAKLLLAAACDHLDGEFARAKLLALDGVKGVITQDRFAEVAQRLERDGVLEPGGPRKARRVARGFYGRAGLLDTVYALQRGKINENEPDQPVTVLAAPQGPNQSPTVGPAVDVQFSPAEAPEGGQDATERHQAEDNDTVYGSEDGATSGLESADGTPEGLPKWAQAAIDKSAEELARERKKRKRS